MAKVAIDRLIPIVGVDVSLAEDASQCANSNFEFLWNDSSIDSRFRASDKLHVATLLTRLNKARGLKPAFDLAVG